jgi:hypothetical protein
VGSSIISKLTLSFFVASQGNVAVPPPGSDCQDDVGICGETKVSASWFELVLSVAKLMLPLPVG